ncbi:MAG: hypothetical protein WA915_05300, partial [Candidatus Aminicenantaceae bacterium]
KSGSSSATGSRQTINRGSSTKGTTKSSGRTRVTKSGSKGSRSSPSKGASKGSSGGGSKGASSSSGVKKK